LVRPFGIEGVALGTAIPNVAFNIAVCVYACRTLQVGLLYYLRRSFLGPLILLPLPIGVWWLLGEWTGVTSWRSFLFVGFSGTACYIAMASIVEVAQAKMIHCTRFFKSREACTPVATAE
jgi:hypothetical protein